MGTCNLINKIYGYKKQGSASGCEHCPDGISVLVWGTVSKLVKTIYRYNGNAPKNSCTGKFDKTTEHKLI